MKATAISTAASGSCHARSQLTPWMAVIAAKTGKSWAQWIATLDAAGAPAMNHTQIAALVHEQHGVPGWWAQGVTVGYERIRGRRSKNQVAGGTFTEATDVFGLGCVLYEAATRGRPGAGCDGVSRPAPVRASRRLPGTLASAIDAALSQVADQLGNRHHGLRFGFGGALYA